MSIICVFVFVFECKCVLESICCADIDHACQQWSLFAHSVVDLYECACACVYVCACVVVRMGVGVHVHWCVFVCVRMDVCSSVYMRIRVRKRQASCKKPNVCTRIRGKNAVFLPTIPFFRYSIHIRTYVCMHV